MSKHVYKILELTGSSPRSRLQERSTRSVLRVAARRESAIRVFRQNRSEADVTSYAVAAQLGLCEAVLVWALPIRLSKDFCS
jgi:flavin-binding protein dodecin